MHNVYNKIKDYDCMMIHVHVNKIKDYDCTCKSYELFMLGAR